MFQIVGLGFRTHTLSTAYLRAVTSIQYLPVNQHVCHTNGVWPSTGTLGIIRDGTAGYTVLTRLVHSLESLITSSTIAHVNFTFNLATKSYLEASRIIFSMFRIKPEM